MNANQLMLDNYLQDSVSKTILKVIEILPNTFSTYVIDRTKFPLKKGWKAEPIPLTKKWLLDFGFKQNELTFSLANDEYSITIFFCDLWKFQYETPLESASLVNDFKVHELQNLYYSLTGRFLKLVEPN